MKKLTLILGIAFSAILSSCGGGKSEPKEGGSLPSLYNGTYVSSEAIYVELKTSGEFQSAQVYDVGANLTNEYFHARANGKTGRFGFGRVRHSSGEVLRYNIEPITSSSFNIVITHDSSVIPVTVLPYRKIKMTYAQPAEATVMALIDYLKADEKKDENAKRIIQSFGKNSLRHDLEKAFEDSKREAKKPAAPATTTGPEAPVTGPVEVPATTSKTEITRAEFDKNFDKAIGIYFSSGDIADVTNFKEDLDTIIKQNSTEAELSSEKRIAFVDKKAKELQTKYNSALKTAYKETMFKNLGIIQKAFKKGLIPKVGVLQNSINYFLEGKHAFPNDGAKSAEYFNDLAVLTIDEEILRELSLSSPIHQNPIALYVGFTPAVLNTKPLSEKISLRPEGLALTADVNASIKIRGMHKVFAFLTRMHLGYEHFVFVHEEQFKKLPKEKLTPVLIHELRHYLDAKKFPEMISILCTGNLPTFIHNEIVEEMNKIHRKDIDDVLESGSFKDTVDKLIKDVMAFSQEHTEDDLRLNIKNSFIRNYNQNDTRFHVYYYNEMEFRGFSEMVNYLKLDPKTPEYSYMDNVFGSYTMGAGISIRKAGAEDKTFMGQFIRSQKYYNYVDQLKKADYPFSKTIEFPLKKDHLPKENQDRLSRLL